VRTLEALEAFRQRHSIPEDLPPITTDDELVAWGQELIGQPADRPRPRRRGEPLRAARRSGATHVAYTPSVTTPAATTPAATPERDDATTAPPARRRSAETMTLDELFDDIAARAAGAHRRSRLRALR